MTIEETRTYIARVGAALGFVCGLIGLLAGLTGHSWKLGPIGWFTGGMSSVPSPASPNKRYTGSACLAERNSPRVSAERSSAALATYTGRGAMSAISMC